MELDEAPPETVLELGRRRYAERWSANAKAYEAQGIYRHLAERLVAFGKISRVIDIGCGRGESLAALREVVVGSDPLLIGLDENPDCLRAAAERLSIPYPNERLRRTNARGKEYDLDFVVSKLPSLKGTQLIQTDLLRVDAELEAILAFASPFDAVTMWFTGIHPARQFDREMGRLNVTDDTSHRFNMDMMVLQYAGALVRPGGLMQIVGRGVANDTAALTADVESDMEALAEHGPVRLEDVQVIPYREPTSAERIGVAARGLSVEDGDTFATASVFRVI